MEENEKSHSFKKLLDRLQEDSWQLELLISGFAIFGLFYALEPIRHQLQVANFDDNKVFLNFFIVVHFSLQILIFNLLLHVLLRGMWIGSLGLRYVFGDIDFDNLNYGEQFTRYLKKNVGSFDSYIPKLENICSVIFALSFLLVFYIFSFFAISFILIAFNNPVADWMILGVQLLFVIFLTGVLLTFFDFLTQGLLKKNKWVSKVYFPFYWVFSLLTLSFLYRPIVYNLLDNKQGKRVVFVLIPIYILVYVVFHLNYQKSNFITPNSAKLSNSNIANGSNYQDIIEKEDDVFLGEFLIQSKVISKPYLTVFVPLNNRTEDLLLEFNPSLKPKKDKRGLYFQSEITFTRDETDYDSLNTVYLSTFEDYFSFSIDDTVYKTEFVITQFNGTLGFETNIGIKGLPEGKHVIDFKRLNHQGSDSLVHIRTVPFWYYEE